MDDDPLASLLTRIAVQDRAAFRAFYAAGSAKLFGTLLRILGNKAEAEDALQEVFTRIWLRAARYDPEKGRAMTWAIAVARNHAIDRLRARPAPEDGGDEIDAMPDARPGALAGLIARGEAQRVVTCMGQLEPDRAEAVRGAYLSGLSYQQLAERFDVPLNTMRTWLRRSLLRLKECLES
ncbi:sigma-70 family RNA polymerase sigma factor [Paracoccaceae bacterium Fryx2]|nr:sigma-70 family RNA polymerase sigma factor [Paracoccaceae bacterium Fryx2]